MWRPWLSTLQTGHQALVGRLHGQAALTDTTRGKPGATAEPWDRGSPSPADPPVFPASSDLPCHDRAGEHINR